jgi:branched-chain amino acid transport system permease protein
MATLAAAEMARILFELFYFRKEVGGETVGPDGTQGFRGIRWVFERGVEPLDYLAIIYALLIAVLVVFLFVERSRLGATLRSVGADPELAAAIGVNVDRLKLCVAASAGALAALGGVLYAHHNTYIEPRNFDTLLGVALDIGALEGSQLFGSARMIVFGGLVAVLLIVRPRGLLDEKAVHWIRARFS